MKNYHNKNKFQKKIRNNWLKNIKFYRKEQK